MVQRVEIADPADAERWTTAWNAVRPDRPRTADEAIHEALLERNRAHWIATDDAGAAVGAAALLHSRWRAASAPPDAQLGVAFDGDAEGLVAALLSAAARCADEWGFDELRVTCRDVTADAPVRGLVRAAGFTCVEADVEARLDVATAPTWDGTLPDGVRITDLEREPALRRSAHRCFTLADRDEPSDEAAAPLEFARWCEALAVWGTWEDCLVAVDDEVTVIGWASLEREALRPDRAWNGFTGTHPDHRGRGIAWALKHALVARAAATGVGAILTENLEDNGPMRRINDRMGYVPTHRNESWRGRVDALADVTGRDRPTRP